MLGPGHARDGTLDADLFAQPRPVETERCARICRKGARLAAIQVGVEDEPSLVNGFQENEPPRGLSPLVNGRQHHGVGLV